MKKIHATWEQRSLGIDAWEIELSKEDKPEILYKAERDVMDLGAEYLVIKIPVAVTSLLEGLSDAGYVFREAAVAVSVKRSEYRIPSILRRFENNAVLVEVKEESACSRVLSEVKKGIFTTDRISLDSEFSCEQAACRYAFWTNDMFNQGNRVFELQVDGEPYGFGVLTEVNSTTVYPTLAGLYQSHMDSGLGLTLLERLMNRCFELGYTRIVSSMSSNNIPVLRSHLLFGFSITDIHYVYTKHLSR